LSAKYSQTKIHQFVIAYVKSKNGELTELSNEVFCIKYPKQTCPTEYTYDPAVSREVKAQLVTLGSPVFQQILKECLARGALCQIMLRPKGDLEVLLKGQFKDEPFACEGREEVTSVDENTRRIRPKNQPCYHQINNAKMISLKIVKEEPVKYFMFYYSASFQSKLRPKNEELITIVTDEEGDFANQQDFTQESTFKNEDIEIENSKIRFTAAEFDKLKTIADQKLDTLLKEKLVLFDLPLNNQKKSKLGSFDKRLRRTYHEQLISKKQDFDHDNWQTSYNALLRRVEESLLTNLSVKFLNLLIINTVKVKFEVKLDNNSTIHASTILGINHGPEVTCPICRKNINEGYATHDCLYVCKNCIRQSIDTSKIYSIKARMRLDETLQEYIEPESGFVCSVCGKKHSQLFEFKCSFDNSSICIYHYELCDICGKVFSKLNLSHTDEFRRQLCPKHAVKRS
jgi:hypothetical protein